MNISVTFGAPHKAVAVVNDNLGQFKLLGPFESYAIRALAHRSGGLAHALVAAELVGIVGGTRHGCPHGGAA